MFKKSILALVLSHQMIFCPTIFAEAKSPAIEPIKPAEFQQKLVGFMEGSKKEGSYSYADEKGDEISPETFLSNVAAQKQVLIRTPEATLKMTPKKSDDPYVAKAEVQLVSTAGGMPMTEKQNAEFHFNDPAKFDSDLHTVTGRLLDEAKSQLSASNKAKTQNRKVSSDESLDFFAFGAITLVALTGIICSAALAVKKIDNNFFGGTVLLCAIMGFGYLGFRGKLNN